MGRRFSRCPGSPGREPLRTPDFGPAKKEGLSRNLPLRPRPLLAAFFLAPRPGLEPGTCGLQRLRAGLSHHPQPCLLGCRALTRFIAWTAHPLVSAPSCLHYCSSFGRLGSGFSPSGAFPEFTRFSSASFLAVLPFDSPSLYRLSYRGRKVILPVVRNPADPILWDYRRIRYDFSTAAIASHTASMLPAFRAATQMRPVLTAYTACCSRSRSTWDADSPE